MEARSEHVKPFVKCMQSSFCWTVNQTEKLVLPGVLMVGEGEEPPEAGEAEAEGEAVAAVALAYVTTLVSPAREWSQENGFCSEKEKRNRFKLGCLYSCMGNTCHADMWIL